MTHRVGRVLAANSGSIEEETDRVHLLALTLAECTHELIKSSRPLDLEENFIVTICDLDIQMLATSRRFRLRAVRGAVVVRHCMSAVVYGCACYATKTVILRCTVCCSMLKQVMLERRDLEWVVAQQI